MSHVRGYGRIPDLPDQRDRLLSKEPASRAPLPASLDLRSKNYGIDRASSARVSAMAPKVRFATCSRTKTSPISPARAVVGGHCMRAIGYTSTHLIVANSWAASWGDKGFCYLPKAYCMNPQLASDWWVLRRA